MNRVRVWIDAIWDLVRHGSAQRFEPPTVDPTMSTDSPWRGWMGTFGRDPRYALRVLRTNPLFTTVAITTLALGIGANTAMYSVIDAVLLSPLSYPESERLVVVKSMDIQAGRIGTNTTPANFADQAARANTFESMAALSGDVVALIGNGETRRLTGVRSAGSLLAVLGTQPLFGRL
jgi:putative ABC transport system permease protein